LMLKDTKSLGNNKAPACESRGFVRKRKKVCILTHLLFYVCAWTSERHENALFGQSSVTKSLLKISQ
ncbi:hypothetical protein PO079_14670, partial [Bacteroides stercoris]|nr:hypothetical protein [Bacteroides stercoris]MDC2331688.1 hypothetical protein [Bacteroides stercoris]MDC2338026.1 hypothetical protein [Bacteroides stercoris]